MKLDAAARMTQLYPDRHLNIFVPYGTYDLDYNVTRALICTLRSSGPELARRFLAELLDVEIAEETSVLYDLQACDYDDYNPESCKVRKILGISRGGVIASRLPNADEIYRPQVLALLRGAASIEEKLQGLRNVSGRPDLSVDELEVLEHTLEEYERGSLPDGWIFTSDQQVCVLIEAKLTRFLDQHQLDRHSETWFGEVRRGGDQVVLSWEQIANFAKKSAESSEPKTSFLCRQLFEYLEILGQAPFESFKPFDLDGDSLLGTLPKAARFVAELASKAAAAGLPIGREAQVQGTSLRLPLTNPAILGSIGIELASDELALTWSVGEPLTGYPNAGPDGADMVLACTDGGLINPLAELKLSGAGYSARIDRFARNPRGLAQDRTVYDAALQLSEFSEVLDELVTQHPRADVRMAQGRCGVLSIRRSFKGEAATVDGAQLIEQALISLKDFLAIAQALSTKA